MLDKGEVHPDFFDIEVQAGVNRPRSRVAQEQKLQWMFDREMVDEEYMVSHSQLEDKDELLTRQKELFEAKKAARLAVAEQAQAPPEAPPQGGGP
jgi:hypothetical protein